MDYYYGHTLKFARCIFGKLQKEIGVAIGKTQHTIQMIEAGTSKITDKEVRLISLYLGRDEEYLFRLHNQLYTAVSNAEIINERNHTVRTEDLFKRFITCAKFTKETIRGING